MKWTDILKAPDDNVFIESLTIKEALELLRKRVVELKGQDYPFPHHIYDDINEAISMQLKVVKILTTDPGKTWRGETCRFYA